MSTNTTNIAQTSINTIRTLAMDAVQAANSGHPGTPMALAPVAYQLWTQHLRYDPANPVWPNRDRYVLSCGHASMLLYSLIHLSGIRELSPDGQKVLDEPSLPLSEIKNFRQWGSRTPGHPEIKHTSGVETTTGPLGQGCGNSVGMAIASRWLAARAGGNQTISFTWVASKARAPRSPPSCVSCLPYRAENPTGCAWSSGLPSAAMGAPARNASATRVTSHVSINGMSASAINQPAAGDWETPKARLAPMP